MSVSVHLRHARDDFALSVDFSAPGGVIALFGRSGSGKTTVVNAVAGLLRPDRARIEINGQTLVDTEAGIWVPPHKRRVGYVFQDARLFPHLSVRQNLTYGQRFAGAADDGVSLEHVVDLLGIGALLERRPGALSGGERQRVAIGRALLAHPRLLLMDEPLAALDAPRKAEILPYLERLRDDTQVPILYVSHALPEVARLASTVVALDAGQVLRAGPTAEVLSDPGAVPGIGVRDAGAVLTGTVSRHHPDGLTEIATSGAVLLLPALEAPPGSTVRIRIAAQDVILSRNRPEGLSALNIFEATVSELKPGTGPGMIVQLRVGDDLILARITRRSADALDLAPGTSCYGIVKTVSVAKGSVGVFGESAFD